MSTKRKDRHSRLQGYLLGHLARSPSGWPAAAVTTAPRHTSTRPVFPPARHWRGHSDHVGDDDRRLDHAGHACDDGKPVVELFLRDADNFSLNCRRQHSLRPGTAQPAANGASSTWHAITRRTEAFGTPARPTVSSAHEADTRPTPRPQRPLRRTSRMASTPTPSPRARRTTRGSYDGSLPHRSASRSGSRRDACQQHHLHVQRRQLPDLPVNKLRPRNRRQRLPHKPTVHAAHASTCSTARCRRRPHRRAIPQRHRPEGDDPPGSYTTPAERRGWRFLRHFRFGNTFTDYSHVVYPQDRRNCTTCHEENDSRHAATATGGTPSTRRPAAPAMTTSISSRAKIHSGVAAHDTCTSVLPRRTRRGQPAGLERSRDPQEQAAAARLGYEVLSVTNSAPAEGRR